MRWTWTAGLVAGAAVMGLGVLWFLQGSDLVHIEPVLCVGECEPMVGHRPGWQIAGAGAAAAGAALLTVTARRLRR